MKCPFCKREDKWYPVYQEVDDGRMVLTNAEATLGKFRYLDDEKIRCMKCGWKWRNDA